ncbi:MAG TPA: anaerobic ribonucleoside-triphosphate reductase activating protein [Mobilitalea sp.]|nr:anaerobic ribonucleoside-triphosphate reductase activating protein [Mobilitalea sp.]
MNYGEIKKYDIANGEGVRVSLFVSGCTHHCKGCFNEETWDFAFGKSFTNETEDEIIEALSHNYINGLSLLGGEPFEKQNQRVLLPFLKKVKSIYPGKNIWCYTGYTLDNELLRDSRARCECTEEMLQCIDVLVDGEFKEELKDISLAFCGSSNQRLIDVKSSLESGKVQIHKIKSKNI